MRREDCMLNNIRRVIALKYLQEQCNNAKKFITDRQENHSENYSGELFESYQLEANILSDAVKIISTVVFTDYLVRIESGISVLGERKARLDWNNKYVSQKDGEIVLGEAMGKIVRFNLNSSPHAMIAGEASSGKSWILRGCVGQMAQKGAIIKMFDFKGGTEFGLECEQFGEVITERHRANEVLKELVEENEKRLSIFRKMGVKNIVEYNQRIGKSLARIIVACDEVAEMLDETGSLNQVKVQMEEYLSTLARCSKVTGINLLLGTQRPDASVINGQIKNNLPIRICGRFSDRARSEFVLGNSAATTLEGGGRFLFREGNEQLEFQAFYYRDEEAINAGVNERSGIMLIHSDNGKENNDQQN